MPSTGPSGNGTCLGELPRWRRPLAVVAHPDDESFGLGAVLARFVDDGAWPSVLCFTHGEASTLHGVPGNLRRIRAREVHRAAELLGVHDVHLGHRPDGRLSQDGPDALAEEVLRAVERWGSDGLLVFDQDGVTGHPDHIAATGAALLAAGRTGLDVLAWTVPRNVAEQLNREFSASFTGRGPQEIDLLLDVRREQQVAAARAHPSQALPESVLWRRLELLAQTEHLVWLCRHADPSGPVDRTAVSL
jgi:N-acetylglucosamine malate deacetylase 2